MSAVIYQTKQCSKCGKLKSITDYYRRSASRDGKALCCKVCQVKYNRDYRHANPEKVRIYAKEYVKRHRAELRRKPLGFISGVYLHMKTRVKGNSKFQKWFYAGLPILARQEFLDWAVSDVAFNRIFKYWLTHGQERIDVPSINRIDPRRGYVMGNLEWLTQSENSSKTMNNKSYREELLRRQSEQMPMKAS